MRAGGGWLGPSRSSTSVTHCSHGLVRGCGPDSHTLTSLVLPWRVSASRWPEPSTISSQGDGRRRLHRVPANRRRKEIDFAPVAVPSPSGAAHTVPIESKWVSSGWRAEARVIEGKFSAGVVATRTVLDL